MPAMVQPPNPYAPPTAYGMAPGTTYPCARCGQYGADYFPAGQPPMHRACAALGPDTLAWPWLLLAYSVVVPLGCTFVGAVLASIPYYVWRGKYPQRARTYNRHVWIGFALSCVLWGGLYAIGTFRR
jgi:hypothetical protein